MLDVEDNTYTLAHTTAWQLEADERQRLEI